LALHGVFDVHEYTLKIKIIIIIQNSELLIILLICLFHYFYDSNCILSPDENLD
jgi:hypothetical protein